MLLGEPLLSLVTFYRTSVQDVSVLLCITLQVFQDFEQISLLFYAAFNNISVIKIYHSSQRMSDSFFITLLIKLENKGPKHTHFAM